MIAAAMECSARNELHVNYDLIHTTYPILFLSVFARQLCLPVPAILFLLSGGGFGNGIITSLSRALRSCPDRRQPFRKQHRGRFARHPPTESNKFASQVI